MSALGRRAHRKAVLEAVDRAFSVARYPGDEKLVYDAGYPDVAEVRDAFKGKVPGDLDASLLRRNAEALGLFTPEALSYYLPAFVRASLTDTRRADIIPLYLCLTLNPPKAEGSNAQEFKKLVAVLTADQKHAIKRFLEFAEQQLDISEARHALHRYWGRF